MPTIALSNSVAYKILEDNGYDSVSAFPPIRVFGTVGFIAAMLTVNFLKNSEGLQFQLTHDQFILSGSLALVLFLYCFTLLPSCKETAEEANDNKTFAQRMGLDAFKLFKAKDMAIFFIFSMMLGVSLQITNGFANPFITSFTDLPEYAVTEKYMRLLEENICEQPYLWLWTHNRWKRTRQDYLNWLASVRGDRDNNLKQ